MCAIGRRPCWDGLFAPELVPETRGRSLLVDEDFRTSIPGVYAIGDVSAVIQLAHVAAAQGIACVNRMCGRQAATDLNVVPSCIYSSPEIAVVGLTEAEARSRASTPCPASAPCLATPGRSSRTRAAAS
ncbi:MAG: FAD-dependent oxidoreductase [Oscillospiraceae bacterium]